MENKITDPALVVLGATSAVAKAYVETALKAGKKNVVLLARKQSALDIIAQDFSARYSATVTSLSNEIGDSNKVDEIFDLIVSANENIDEVLVAYGVLGEQEDLQSDLKKLAQLLDVNFVSTALWMEKFAAKFEQQEDGRIVVIGSVAGDRGRMSNYLYGASKGALERLAQGMAHRFGKLPSVSVTIAKPGFIDTPMTAHIPNKGPLWASPDTVALNIFKAAEKRKLSTYTPGFWALIMLIIRSVPNFVMHKTKL